MKILNYKLSILLSVIFVFMLIFPLSTYSYAQQKEEKAEEMSFTGELPPLSVTITDETDIENRVSTTPENTPEIHNFSDSRDEEENKNNDNIITVTESPIEIESFSTATDIKENLLPIPSEIDKSTTSYAVFDDKGEIISGLNDKQSYPALSLIKLLLGYWVLNNGEDLDKPLVENMIRSSNDFIATYLDDKYSDAINVTIDEFQLLDTVKNDFWGNSYTTSYDMSKFLYDIKGTPTGEIIIGYMKNYDGIAADGTAQNYGVAKIPSNRGVKFGWSNEHDYTSTTGYIGDNQQYVISVFSIGNENKNTYDSLFAWKSIDPSFVVPSDIILNADEDIKYPEKKDIDINQSPFKTSEENIKNETLNDISEEEKSNPIKYYVIILLLFISLICSLAYIVRQKMLNKTYNDKGGKHVTA